MNPRCGGLGAFKKGNISIKSYEFLTFILLFSVHQIKQSQYVDSSTVASFSFHVCQTGFTTLSKYRPRITATRFCFTRQIAGGGIDPFSEWADAETTVPCLALTCAYRAARRGPGAKNAKSHTASRRRRRVASHRADRLYSDRLQRLPRSRGQPEADARGETTCRTVQSSPTGDDDTSAAAIVGHKSVSPAVRTSARGPDRRRTDVCRSALVARCRGRQLIIVVVVAFAAARFRLLRQMTNLLRTHEYGRQAR